MSEVVDRIDTQAGKITALERDDLFTKLLLGKDVIEKVETSRGVFTVKYPKPDDLMTIGRVEALRRDYKPPASFNYETEMINVMASTLDVIVVSGPDWFTNAKKLNPDFTFLEVPSRAFLVELYSKAHSFRDETERRLGEAEKPADKRVPAADGNDVPPNGGAFGDLSSEPGDTGT